MKRLLKIAAMIVAILLAVVIALPFLFDADYFRPALETRLSAVLGRPVTVGNLSLALFSGGVQASELMIAEDPRFGSEPFLRAASLDAGVDLYELIFNRRLSIKKFVITQPRIRLLQAPDGDWNFSTLGGKPEAVEAAATPAKAELPDSAPLDLAIDLIQLSDGHLLLAETASGGNKRELENVDIEIREFSPTVKFPVSLKADVVGGGKVSIDGQAGPIPPAESAATPFDAHLVIEQLNLQKSGFADPRSGTDGILSADANANSDGNRISVKGTASVRDLKIAKNGSPAKKPLEAEFALNHNRSTQKGVIERFPVRIGGAQVMLTGTYDLSGASTVIDTRVKGDNVPLTDLAAILPALDVALPSGATIERGTANVDLASQGPTANLSTTGSLSLNDTVLANFSLTDKLKVLERLTSIQAEPKTTIQFLNSGFAVNAQGTTIHEAKLIVPAIGELTGSGTISPDHRLDLRMRAAVNTQRVAAALGGSGGTLTIPFLVQGTSSDPSFKADLRGVANQKLEEFRRDPAKAVDAAKGIIDLFKKRPANK
jgi:AsmA protein